MPRPRIRPGEIGAVQITKLAAAASALVLVCVTIRARSGN